MLDNIFINSFDDVSYSLKRMNPISKILCVLIFLILTFVDSSFQFYLILGVTLIISMLLSNISLKIFLKIFLSLFLFIILIFLINFLCNISIDTSIINSLRLIFIAFYFSILVLTTSNNELICGLEYVLSPLKIFKIPVNFLVLKLLIVLNFIPIIFSSLKKITNCYKMKGIYFYNLSFSLKLSYIKNIIVSTLKKTFNSINFLSNYMSLKLYNSKKIVFDNYGYSKMDVYMLSLHFVLVIILIMKGIY